MSALYGTRSLGRQGALGSHVLLIPTMVVDDTESESDANTASISLELYDRSFLLYTSSSSS